MLPNLDYGLAYRVMASIAYPKIKEIIENTLASALIYLPSSALDFKVPELRPYLDQFVRGSNGYSRRRPRQADEADVGRDRHASSAAGTSSTSATTSATTRASGSRR